MFNSLRVYSSAVARAITKEDVFICSWISFTLLFFRLSHIATSSYVDDEIILINGFADNLRPPVRDDKEHAGLVQMGMKQPFYRCDHPHVFILKRATEIRFLLTVF